MTGLRALLAALHKARVEFIIVGGIAARIHGASRVTQDVDIAYGRSEANLGRLVKALAAFKPYLRGAPPGLPFEWSVATLASGLNFTLTTDAGDIDLLGELVGGGGYEDLARHAVTFRIFGQETRVLDLPWLIRLKRAAGRPKDLETLAELEVLREERGE